MSGWRGGEIRGDFLEEEEGEEMRLQEPGHAYSEVQVSFHSWQENLTCLDQGFGER